MPEYKHKMYRYNWWAGGARHEPAARCLCGANPIGEDEVELHQEVVDLERATA